MRTAIPVVNRSASVSSAAESCEDYKNEWAYDDSGVVSYPGRVVGDFEVLDELANKREDEGEGDLSVTTRIRPIFERESRGSGCTGSANRIRHRTSTCSVGIKGIRVTSSNANSQPLHSLSGNGVLSFTSSPASFGVLGAFGSNGRRSCSDVLPDAVPRAALIAAPSYMRSYASVRCCC